MAHFEVIEREGLFLVKSTLNNETVRTESGAMYYIRGNIKMESKMPSAGGFLKSMVTGENIFRPTYTGSGELYLEPSFATQQRVYGTLALFAPALSQLSQNLNLLVKPHP
ncbi:MAG: hypothetical protein CVV27_12480, partial [Candidatus Melainabacteria bacterium HGW-Melainabacteria-1]